ncbi:uncharacterized protein LOC125833281 [Solanum verrucosum]|uniref:uncharacterized protein LOC125833281 n=1 Tax=Solanum verrucosum TaxID=315347 RepID=UPI0020D148A6|nr:uncharacterized protein LOC125833281 [Solanum verrucosum]
MTSDVERVVEIDGDKIEVTKETKNTTEKEAEIAQKLVPMPRPPPPFPQRLVQKAEEGKYQALKQMPGYAKFMKDLVTKTRAINFKNDERLQHCRAISTRSRVHKKEDPGAFTISCTIGKVNFAKALCDLGASINLMPLSIYKRTMKKSIGDLQDVLVKVGPFIFSEDFVILDCEVDFEVPIILGRPFIAIRHALVDMERGQMKFRLNKEEVTFNICKSIKQESDLTSVLVVSHTFGRSAEVFSKGKLCATLHMEKKHHAQ